MTTRFSDHLLTGTHASRPAATAVPAGTLYSCSTHGLIYQSDGATWTTYATLGGTETLAAIIIDAKGDLIGGTAADTAARLAVGTNAQVLTADSAETTGMKWATPSAGAAGAVTLLSTTTRASDGAIDISSISGAYTDLIVCGMIRSNASGSMESWRIQLNGDTGSNYNYQYTEGNGATTSSSGSNGYPGIALVEVVASTTAANVFTSFEFKIMNYASTAFYKSLQGQYATGGNSAGTIYGGIWGGVWKNTAAVNRIVFVGGSSGQLITGSTVRVYGRT